MGIRSSANLSLEEKTSQEEMVDTVGTSARASESRGRVYIETYGCQMNVSDSEVVQGVLQKSGYTSASQPQGADVIFLNTCAIRDKAEQRVWNRLRELNRNFREPSLVSSKLLSSSSSSSSSSSAAAAAVDEMNSSSKGRVVVGILGCMAERLKEKLLDKDRLVDIVAGPDAYRDLPRLLQAVTFDSQAEEEEEEEEEKQNGLSYGINVQLSIDETYADVLPVRSDAHRKKAFVTIMRGCNNMCTFCIVPFVRGKERSRDVSSILEEVKRLSDEGVREITLLGQNVNSYADFSKQHAEEKLEKKNNKEKKQKQKLSQDYSGARDGFEKVYAKGFKSVYKPKRTGSVSFAELLDQVARAADPEVRIRFTSPHPKDFSDEVLDVIRRHPNVCNQLHMPAQSGSTSCLQRMRRGYTHEAYIDLIERARAVIPNLAISTDMISGFCGETEEEHQDTLKLMDMAQYESAFCFAYSRRDKTYAARHLEDDVDPKDKMRRLNEVIAKFRHYQSQKCKLQVGSRHCVLVDGFSRKSTATQPQMLGRTDTNMKVVFCPTNTNRGEEGSHQDPFLQDLVGKYCEVEIVESKGATLLGEFIQLTTLAGFYKKHGAMQYEL